MAEIHSEQGLANKNFEKPDGLTTVTYCSATGMSPTELCAQDYYGKTTHSDLATTDYTLEGTCDLHQTYVVCKESGKVASPMCPVDCQVQVVLAVDTDKDGKTKIYSKPETVPEDKMDIFIDEVCDLHQGGAFYPTDDPFASTDPDAGYGDMIPDDAYWEDENFGIQ